MPNQEIQFRPVDFITVGTVGPKGRRVFHLQAGQGEQLVTLQIEKEQAWALSEALGELLNELPSRFPDLSSDDDAEYDPEEMDLRKPLQPLFRVAQMGLGYDEANDLVVLIIEELLTSAGTEEEEDQPSKVRLWASRQKMRQLSSHSHKIVSDGRPNPSQNGHIRYYWGH